MEIKIKGKPYTASGGMVCRMNTHIGIYFDWSIESRRKRKEHSQWNRFFMYPIYGYCIKTPEEVK